MTLRRAAAPTAAALLVVCAIGFSAWSAADHTPSPPPMPEALHILGHLGVFAVFAGALTGAGVGLRAVLAAVTVGGLALEGGQAMATGRVLWIEGTFDLAVNALGALGGSAAVGRAAVAPALLGWLAPSVAALAGTFAVLVAGRVEAPTRLVLVALLWGVPALAWSRRVFGHGPSRLTAHPSAWWVVAGAVAPFSTRGAALAVGAALLGSWASRAAGQASGAALARGWGLGLGLALLALLTAWLG